MKLPKQMLALITEIGERGAGAQTIHDVVGHVSERLLEHSGHVQMQAKRKILESIVIARTAERCARPTRRPRQQVPQERWHGKHGRCSGRHKTAVRPYPRKLKASGSSGFSRLALTYIRENPMRLPDCMSDRRRWRH